MNGEQSVHGEPTAAVGAGGQLATNAGDPLTHADQTAGA